MRVALFVSGSSDDHAVYDAARVTYRELVAEDHDVDCFLVGSPTRLDGFATDRTRLCVVDSGFRAGRWTRLPAPIARLVRAGVVHGAERRLRGAFTRAARRAAYDAVVEPRRDR